MPRALFFRRKLASIVKLSEYNHLGAIRQPCTSVSFYLLVHELKIRTPGSQGRRSNQVGGCGLDGDKPDTLQHIVLAVFPWCQQDRVRGQIV